MWKPFLLEFLESDTNPTLNSDISLGGWIDVCNHDTGECDSHVKSGAIDSSSFSAHLLSPSGLMVVGQLLEAVTSGDVLNKTTGGWRKASSTSHRPGFGIALEDGGNSDEIEILIYGSLKDGNLNIPENKTILYLHLHTFTTSPGDWNQVLGCRIIDTNKIFFKPDFVYINKLPTQPQIPT